MDEGDPGRALAPLNALGPGSFSHLALPLGELSPEVTERVPGQGSRFPERTRPRLVFPFLTSYFLLLTSSL